MSPFWQQLGVYGMLVIAGGITVWSSVNAWRAMRRGECGNCPGCNGNAVDPTPDRADQKERLVFLPTDDLRRSAARGKHGRTSEM